MLSIDVFVKVILVQGQKQASKKWQSTGRSSAPSPIFNQKFQFQLSAPLAHLESEQISLNVILLCRYVGTAGVMGRAVGRAVGRGCWEGLLGGAVGWICWAGCWVELLGYGGRLILEGVYVTI